MMKQIQLGAFSVSLAVKDIHVSKDFYEHLGFQVMGGDIEKNWLILKNGETIIGLFQGMFPTNMLTFNPGWNQQAQNLDSFDDIRDIQAHLKNSGIPVSPEVDETTHGPGHLSLVDPDGNVILIDQHR